MTKKLLLMCMTFGIAAAAPSQAPVPADQEPMHRLFFSNEHVHALRVEIPPQEASQLHRHDRDALVVWLVDSTFSSMEPGKPPQQFTRKRGEAQMTKAGLVHSVRNDGNAGFRTTVVEFMAPQGEIKQLTSKPSRYCNPNSKTACVTERYLFCTAKVCVSEVEMGPGAVTMKHSHSTDHLVIAVSDLEMKDWIEGRPAAVERSQTGGEVLFVDAGITHQLANGPKPAHMIVVSWK